MAHTKGDWTISSYRPREIWMGADYHIATVHNFNSKEETHANARLIAAAPKQHAACKAFLDGWSHFCNCIAFNKSNLDADAIRFMNEVPGQIETAYKVAKS